ncbi:MAG: hypothetical protein IT559_00325 [Alphaproteobacteria bacterium]|nr:hypothetical protein [Alphaproteobacteria bacterium]
MSAAGAIGISGLSAVALGAAGVGVCATSAQYALDCYKAHKAGEKRPEFSVKNYGLKALFTSASAALGLEALNTDPETVLDKLKAALEKVFTFFSGTAQATTNIIARPELSSIKDMSHIQMYPLNDNASPPVSILDNAGITPSAFFSGLNTEGWTQKAKEALTAAQRGQPWGMQDIAHFAANGELGKGISRNYELAGQAALMAKESAEAQGNHKILGLSTTFLNDLSKIGAFSESRQIPHPLVTETSTIAASLPPKTHECDLERTVINKYSAITMSCTNPDTTVNIGDKIKVMIMTSDKIHNETHIYEIGKNLAGREMPLGSLFNGVYIANTNENMEHTLAQRIARNASNATEEQLASALQPKFP